MKWQPQTTKRTIRLVLIGLPLTMTLNDTESSLKLVCRAKQCRWGVSSLFGLSQLSATWKQQLAGSSL